MTKIVFPLALIAALAFGAPAGAESGSASVLIVHGIPGRDVAAALDPLLPVDVLVAGKYCLLQGFTFGSIAGPFTIPAGTYPVAISLANPLNPCSNAPVISGNVTVPSSGYAAVVAALSTNGTPTAEAYPIDVSSVGAGQQRFVVAHAANAPGVKVTIASVDGEKEKKNFNLTPGQEGAAELAARNAFTVSLSKGKTSIVSTQVSPGNQGVAFVAAVGTAASGSVTLLSKTIPNAF